MGARQRIRRLTPYLLLAPGHPLAARLLRLPEHPDVHQLVLDGHARDGLQRSRSRTGRPTPRRSTGTQPQFLRSLVYGAAATVICFLIAYPLAYTIAFRGGRWKNLLLFLVIAPFFTSFLLRTQSWKIILGDDGILFGPLKDLGFLPPEFRVLATPAAVVAGIAYNFLPFMTLPIYVSLEKIDSRLVEAAKDLYAGPWRPGGTIAGAVIGGARRGGHGAAALDYPIVGDWASSGLVVGVVVGTFFVSESFTPRRAPAVAAGRVRRARC